MINQTCKYGTFEFLKPFNRRDYGGHGTWYRKNIYTRNNDGEQFEEMAFCLGGKDMSDVFIASERKYHPACPSCYLGHNHTVALHNYYTEDGNKVWEK